MGTSEISYQPGNLGQIDGEMCASSADASRRDETLLRPARVITIAKTCGGCGLVTGLEVERARVLRVGVESLADPDRTARQTGFIFTVG